ncbi:hypothetical protein FEK35_23810 [Nocardia cyriacigeorgica]|uniref:Uncharacterized protein n=1 Tax=Nocardia cyriacigeorgica TaxID=135487 RepID=A0A5R8P9A2_9NOCA|nr:hypothetical protein [Nocardia cyriacigeorgica]TLG01726.1 hypothetical protein FEK35_23810 [Nocardia cyriacigeorgica]
MSGDPVEESSVAVRQGFVQALQTAHTTAALMQRRGGETRSRAEHNQRMSNDAARETRSQFEYQMRVLDAIDKAYQGRQLHAARVEEVRKRIEQGGELHKKDLEYKNDQIERGKQDLDRRNTSEVLERGRLDAVHEKKIEGYRAREERAGELHKLDAKYKRLLIKTRRRAAGLSDTLTAAGEAGEAMASAAAFATAQAASDLSDTHREAAAAFTERFAEDTGLDPGALIDDTATDLPHWEPNPADAALLDNLNGLTEELSMAAHLDQNASATSPALTAPGQVIDAVIAAAVADPDPAADPEPAPEPAAETAATVASTLEPEP